jgi:hypothetical protein
MPVTDDIGKAMQEAPSILTHAIYLHTWLTRVNHPANTALTCLYGRIGDGCSIETMAGHRT